MISSLGVLVIQSVLQASKSDNNSHNIGQQLTKGREAT